MNGLTFITGGARSGKSRLALNLAEASGAPVAMIATAEARDAEMHERIAAHRSERPSAWRTVEEPLDLAGALRGLAAGEFAIVDCLSLWVSNLLERSSTRTSENRSEERTIAPEMMQPPEMTELMAVPRRPSSSSTNLAGGCWIW